MTTEVLLGVLIERFGLIVAAAFLLLSFRPLERFGGKHSSSLQTVFYMSFFGLFGILGTYSGNDIHQSVANLRAMAVITGGLFGGPVVGAGAGLIAGLHRNLIDIGGFSAVPCGLATFIEGLVAGLVARKLGDGLDWRAAGAIGILGETLHMGLVLLLSRPFDDALHLVKIIGMPMVVVNTLGAILFVQIISLVFKDREKRDSDMAEQILSIANQTVSHLRGGLNAASARETARIIYDRIPISAVSITDDVTVLAHIGIGDDHHTTGCDIKTLGTRRVLETGEPLLLNGPEDIGCHFKSCPLYSGIVVPLRKGERIIGTLKFYGSKEDPLDRIRFELAKGLGSLFSTQLELEDLHLQTRMLAHAEIRRLQAQINPHFLFNSLNTIAAFCRTNSDKARELLLDLSRYMRRNLDSSRGFIPLSDELEQVQSYLAIEQARFGDRIRVQMDVAPGCESWPVPPLLIQPIVENGVKHGIARREEGGLIQLSISRQGDELCVAVLDNGVGMAPEQVEHLITPRAMESASEGIGVMNCHQRLAQMFGPEYGLHIDSLPGQGTQVLFRIPRAPVLQ
ncbi:MAG: LytS/YhcK type 5TM receptor domain-containing protein [Halodesulfovibrio sp.]